MKISTESGQSYKLVAGDCIRITSLLAYPGTYTLMLESAEHGHLYFVDEHAKRDSEFAFQGVSMISSMIKFVCVMAELSIGSRQMDATQENFLIELMANE